MAGFCRNWITGFRLMAKPLCEVKRKLFSCVQLFATHGLYSPWISPGQNTRIGSLSLLQGIFPTQGSNPGIQFRYLALQVDSLPALPPGKPENTGVGSLSLLQGIFLTQESNQGLLHWGWILYHVSYQGSNSRVNFSVRPMPWRQHKIS